MKIIPTGDFKQMTDKPKPKRKPEERETANARLKRFRESKPPEVRGIYAPKSQHQAIKAFAKSLKTKPTGE